MPVKRRYSSPAPIEVKSFSFTDNVTRTGYITFYGVKTQDDYFLSQQSSLLSDTVTTLTAGAAATTESGANVAPNISVDFDVTFKAPQYIEGDIIIQVPHGFRDTGNQTTFQKIRATVKHVRDATETDLVVITGSTFAPGITAAVDTFNATSTLSGNVPRTHFSVQDTFRIKTEVLTWEAGGNAHFYFLGHDPAGREFSEKDSTAARFSGGAFTTFKADVPFQIQ